MICLQNLLLSVLMPCVRALFYCSANKKKLQCGTTCVQALSPSPLRVRPQVGKKFSLEGLVLKVPIVN